MEIIAIFVLILVGTFIEQHLYKKILPHIIYDCHFSKEEAIEGDMVEIVETVMNPSKLFVPCLKSEISTSNRLAFAGNVSTVNDQTRSLASLFSIRGRQQVRRTWKVKCLQRGAFKLEDTTVVASDLFGNYHYSNMLKLSSQLVVLPRPVDVEAYINKINEVQGDRVVKRFILEDPFIVAGVREYASRDAMNKIHWGITARQGQLMVRNNEATSKQSLTIMVNNQLTCEQLKEPMHDERLEAIIRIAAGELDRTISTSTPVRLLANGAVCEGGESLETRMMWGQTHVHELFVLLASLQDTFTEHFDKFLEHYGASVQSTEVIVLTCYIDEAMVKFVLNKKNEGIRVKIYVLAYEADSRHYDNLEVYYLLDYLKEVGEKL